MTARRAVFDIQIDDAQFVALQERFKKFQEQQAQQAQAWTGTNDEIKRVTENFEKMQEALREQNASAGSVAEKSDKTSKASFASGLAWGVVTKNTTGFFRGISEATLQLNKWTQLTTVFAGIVGAGGLYGINRLAVGAAGQRQSAAGMGTSIGELNSAQINFGRLGNIGGMLGRWNDALHDVKQRGPLVGLGVRDNETDPARAFAEALPAIKRRLDATDPAMLGDVIHGMQWDSALGMDVHTAQVIRSMSGGEVDEIRRRNLQDQGPLGLSDDVAKKWQDFETQLDRAKGKIAVSLEKNLVHVAPGLNDVSKSLVKLIKEGFKPDGPLTDWLKRVNRGVEDFSHEIGSDGTKETVADFLRKFDATTKDFEAINDWFASHGDLLKFLAATAVGARVGFAVGGFGGAALGVTGTALGATVMPQGLNGGEDERARQQRYGQTRGTGVYAAPHDVSRSTAEGTLSPAIPHEFSTYGGSDPDAIVRSAADQLGKNAVINKNDVEAYLRDGGQGLDPTKQNWCAAFVGSTLRHAGYPAPSSNLASDYENYGTAEQPGVARAGDVGVLARGVAPGNTGAHVGILTGKRDQQGRYEMIEGNVGGAGHGARSVERRWERPEELTIRRPPTKPDTSGGLGLRAASKRRIFGHPNDHHRAPSNVTIQNDSDATVTVH